MPNACANPVPNTIGNIAIIPTDVVTHVIQDAEANARLIAQAPALLKSCHDLIDTVDWGDLFDHDFDCQEPQSCVFCIAKNVSANTGG